MRSALELFHFFYPENTPLKQLLYKHSMQVRNKALEILHDPACSSLKIDESLVSDGALLHDIGICRCHAPSILCEGTEDYMAHGILGAAMLRSLKDPELEKFARICERHIGTGLSAKEIREKKMPLPEQDFFPETNEEKLICLADKFFSKSGDMLEKDFPRVRKSVARYGEDSLKRFDDLCKMFYLTR